MNEHDGLEPTAPMPRIEPLPRIDPAAGRSDYVVSPPPSSVIVDPVPGGPPRPPPLRRFGNPFVYLLRRALAFALDFIVISSVATMLLYGLIAVNPFTGLPNNLEGGFDATLGMGIGIALLYLFLAEAIFGTTLGKLAFALHVYAVKGRFVGPGRAFTRNLLRPVDALVIGIILAILPGHRRLGDLFGGTVVAHSPLRAFSPFVGWLLVVALCAVPFFVASGPVTVIAVGAAFVQFVPPLISRSVNGAAALVTQAALHLPASAASPSPGTTPANDRSPVPAASSTASAGTPAASPAASVPTAAPANAATDAPATVPPEAATAAPTADAPTAAPTDAPTAAPPTAAPTDAATDLPLQTPQPVTTG